MCFISPVLAFIIQVTIQDSKGLVGSVLRSSVCISADCWVTGAGLQSKLEFTSFPLCI